MKNNELIHGFVKYVRLCLNMQTESFHLDQAIWKMWVKLPNGVSSLHCQKVYWVYISLPVWMRVYRYSINASAPMNYIFIEFYTISRFYVTLYLLSYCIFHFSWCRIYMYIYMYVYIRIMCICIFMYMPANACYYVYMIICMSFMCAHFMYADFVMFFLPMVAWSEMT